MAIYQRVIKKIYDRDRGQEVIDALHENPSVAVPVLLRRLKQKDEEWKRSQREWNKVWREIDAKNFAKSLDHQGIVFKTTDRKAMNVKSLLTEIEVLHREQREKRSNLANRYQIDFVFQKDSVFSDIRQLLLRFVEGNSSISSDDEERIKHLMRSFIPKFFSIEYLPEYIDTESQENGNQGSPADVPSQHDLMDLDQAGTDENIKDDSKPRKRTSYTFYANTIIYALIRLYQVIFSALKDIHTFVDAIFKIIKNEGAIP